MKKTLILLITILILLPIFANQSKNEPYQIYLENKKIDTINVQKDRLSATLMMDTVGFMQEIDGYSDWQKEANTMLTFANNCQTVSHTYSHFATIAGFTEKLSASPYWQENKYFLPIEFLCSAYDFELSIDKDKIYIHKRDSTTLQIIEDTECESFLIKELGLQSLMPYGWKMLPAKPEVYRYGINDQYDDYSISYQRISLQGQHTADFIKQFKRQLAINHPKMKISDEKIIDLGSRDFMHFKAKSVKLATQEQYDYYFIEHSNYLYIVESQIESSFQNEYFFKLRDEILANIEFNDSYFQNREHLYLYKNLFTYGLELNKLQENQQVYNYLPFTAQGNIPNNALILYATVSKGKEKITFKLNKDEQQFNAKIYTPFGTGRHNILIFTQDQNKQNVPLIALSVVNLANDLTKYLIPTDQIDADSTEISSLADYFIHNSSNSYTQAKNIFDYIYNNIKLNAYKPSPSNSPKLASQVLTSKSGSDLELNLLFTALLRAADISARIVRAEQGQKILFATEAKINGKWHVYDLASAIRIKNAPYLSIQKINEKPSIYSLTNFKYINRDKYISFFDHYSILKY